MKYPLIYTGKVWHWTCSRCDCRQTQNFNPADYMRCLCRLRHKQEGHRDPSPEALEAVWARRRPLPCA